MKTFSSIVIALPLLALIGGAVLAQSGNDLFQQALVKERTEGDLTEAIKLYQRIVQKYASDHKLAAKALLQMGQAYEKLGNAEARKAYERIGRDFSDQKDIAADAGRRLAALNIPATASDGPRLVMGDIEYTDFDLGRGASISPDGRWMAMTDRHPGNVLVREMSTGQTKRLQTGTCMTGTPKCDMPGFPTFSPDMREIAYGWFDTTGEVQLRVIANEVGAKPRILVRSPEDEVWPQAWSPDGKSILVRITKPDHARQIAWVSLADNSMKVVKSLGWRELENVSLSPDGRYITYSALAVNPRQFRPPAFLRESTERHIYCLAADGSSETELVKTASVNDAPVWTPDGTHLVFTSKLSGQFDLWAIAVRNGKPEGSPALVRRDVGEITPIGMTQSGSYYYGREKTFLQLVSIVELAATGPSRLLNTFVGLRPSWSPDGKSITFSRRTATSGADFELVLRSLATGDEQVYRKRFPNGDNYMVGPARWLKDSQSLLIFGPGSWHQLDLKTGNFTEAANRDPLRTAVAAVSPDNKTLYVVGLNPASPQRNTWDRILSIDLATQQQKDVMILPGPPFPAFNQIGIAPSPDNRTLAIATIASPKLEARIGLVDIASGKYRELYGPYPAIETNDKLVWTKDGRAILFVTQECCRGDAQIMRIGIEGGKPESIGLTAKFLSNFDVSPDGSRIVFGSRSGGAYGSELLAMDNLPELLKKTQ